MNRAMSKVLIPLLLVTLIASNGCSDRTEGGQAVKQAILVPLKPRQVPDTLDLPEAFSYTIAQAMKGDPESMFDIGWAYTEERPPLPRDSRKAAVWFLLAAERGHLLAQYNLALSYLSGDGVQTDIQQAREWFLKAAAQGDADAQFNVGLMFDKGDGVPQDDVKAVSWYRKAAEGGSASAQLNLGSMYKLGEGVKRNLSEAAHWYQKAADQGEPGSQYELGRLYSKGEGVPQDNAKAYIWLTLAQPWYPRDTEQPLRELRHKLTKEQLAEAEKFIDNFNFENPRYVIPRGGE